MPTGDFYPPGLLYEPVDSSIGSYPFTLADISRLDVKKGDILVIQSPRIMEIPAGRRDALVDEFGRLGVKVVMTNDETKLTVVRPSRRKRRPRLNGIM